MIKSLLFSICLVGAVFSKSFAQSSEELQKAAQQYAQASLEGDLETLLDFTYPHVLEKSGGREALKAAMADACAFQKEQCMQLHKFEVGKAGATKQSSSEIHALVPVKTTTKVPHGELVSQNTWIAIFDQNSQKWFFIDTSAIDMGNIHGYIPTWDNTLGSSFKDSMTFVSN